MFRHIEDPVMRLASAHPEGGSLVIRAAMLLLVASITPAAVAAIFTVGATGSGCTHNTIQDAINAAEASAGADTVRITRSLSYTGQQIFVNTTQHLNIVGGFATCTSPASDGQKTVVSAAGPNNHSVFNISGTATSIIRFRLLRLTGGHAGNGYGGGINYVGDGTVELIEMAIDNNRANYGGGIYFQGTNSQAELIISNDNLINGNTADISGGGIYLQQAEMTMTAPGSSIFNNSAVNYGGGLRLYGAQAGTTATVGSSGFSGLTAIYGNEARWGGGVALQGLEDDGSGNARFYLNGGASISNNFARESGGAIYLQNHFSFNDFGDVDAGVNGGVLESNIAPQASAVYVGHDDDGLGLPRGSQFQMSGSRVSGNLSLDASNNPTGGAVIVVSESGRTTITRSLLQDNIAGAVVRADNADDVIPTTLNHCVVSGNVLQRGVVEALNGAPLEILGSTIAGNTLSGNIVITASGGLTLVHSIVWQPGKQSAQISGTRVVDDVIASELVSLVNSPSVIYADPRFIDPQRNDYRLRAASPAVDFSGGTDLVDINGSTHNKDMTLVTDAFGVADIGAYEVQSIGNLALNQGFVEDLRLWTTVWPGAASWSSSGANSTGSTHISYTRSDPDMPAAGTLIGLSQCIRIPGPGSYRLSGFAYGDGSSNLDRDRVSLRWTYRASTNGETCTGSITGEGTVTFPSAATFVAPTSAAIIDVPASQWTDYSAVEVSLAVVEGSLDLLTTTSGHFDGIVLEHVEVMPSALFANSFE
jgi:predicted outer membrane repeat protein